MDYYPAELKGEIDEINVQIYANVNNGVYHCGFATTQEAYESSFKILFECLDQLESKLERRHYLCGEQISEADWRLFTTLIRFDVVYYTHFKTNLRRISDHPKMNTYTREIYLQP